MVKINIREASVESTMDPIIIFSLVLLTLVRLVGLGISIELYVEKKFTRFIYHVVGWLLCVFAGIFSILAGIDVENFLSDILYLLSGICISTGILLVFVGIVMYFREISSTVVIVVVTVLILITISLFMLAGPSLSSLFSWVVFFLIFISLVLMGIVGKNLRKYLGEGYRWFYVLFIIVILFLIFIIAMYIEGYSYGLYQSENTVVNMIYYFFGITINFLLVFNLMTFEHGLSTFQKFQLKDKYSHDLGNDLQVIQAATSLVCKTGEIKSEEVNKKLELIKQATDNAKKLIIEIRKL